MDAVILDGLLGEIRSAVVGRHLGRVRLLGPRAAAFEISGREPRWLVADADRAAAGFYLVPRADVRALGDAEAARLGKAGQAGLLLRKHLGGARIDGLSRVAGERWLVLAAGEGQLVLRPGAPSPALTLAVRDEPLASLGDGGPAWPPPPPDVLREWDRADPALIVEAATRAAASGRVGELLDACPGLGPRLGRALLREPGLWPSLRARLTAPRPTLRAPGPPESWHDVDLADPHAVALLPVELPRADAPARELLLHPEDWIEAARLFWTARQRGSAFAARQRRLADARRHEARRLAQLEAHLQRDLEGLPEEEGLRRRAEALLAYGPALPPGASEVDLPDPREPGRVLRVVLDPRLPPASQADRLYARARRVLRSRGQMAARLEETRAGLAAARAALAAVEGARDLADLGPEPEGRAAPARDREAGPRHYLTSGGLSFFVGRGARENHELTFGRSHPEDYWLHARDVPGAHVILRDREGRATAEDVREAAEVAAFFSGSERQPWADVHFARRKHVHPAGGGPGRVRVTHSETVRVKPRDPEGRLRRRQAL